MSAWRLFTESDAAVVLAGTSLLLGYVFGVAQVCLLFWRRLTHRDGGELRLLRMALDDTQATVRAKQAVIDEQTAQIHQLYRDLDRLSRVYIERAGRGAA